MCTINNKAELERKIEELRKYKAMAEEATSIEKALEHEISSYMEDNNLTEYEKVTRFKVLRIK